MKNLKNILKNTQKKYRNIFCMQIPPVNQTTTTTTISTITTNETTTINQPTPTPNPHRPATRRGHSPCAPIPSLPHPPATAATGRRRSWIIQIPAGWVVQVQVQVQVQGPAQMPQQSQQQQHHQQWASMAVAVAAEQLLDPGSRLLDRHREHRDSSGPSPTFRMCQLAASSLIRKPSNQLSMQTGNLQKLNQKN